MKDRNERKTPDLLTGEIHMMFQINYKYRGPNNKARSGALIMDAATSKDAEKAAHEELKKEHSWYKLTSTTNLDK